MYYFLNYIPFILYIVIVQMQIQIDFSVYVMIYLFGQPLYLLIVNLPWLCKKWISYFKGIVYMSSVIIVNCAYTMIMQKIKTGCFLGDVPIGIYFLMVFVPSCIIFIGTGMICFIEKCRKKYGEGIKENC